MIRPGSTYADLEKELDSTLEGINSMLLECVYGPRPYWRLARPHKKIPLHSNPLYFADRSWTFVLATVRSPKCDLPLLICRSKNNTWCILNLYSAVDPQKDECLTIADQVEPIMQRKQLTLRKITNIFGQTDIRIELFNYSDYRTNPTFPTAFFIDTDYGEISGKGGMWYSNKDLAFRPKPS